MPGAEKLRDCAVLERMTRAQRDSGKLYAAICATPAVFLQVGWCPAGGVVLYWLPYAQPRPCSCR